MFIPRFVALTLAWFFIALRSQASQLVLWPNSMDQIVGDRQAGAVQLGYYASAAGATEFPILGREGVVGVGGSSPTRTHTNVVLGYTLPRLAAGNSVQSATLSVEVASRNSSPPEVDLYGLGLNNPSLAPINSTDTSLFLNADTDPTQTKLVDNLITPALTNGTPGNTLPKTFQADVTAFINSLYAGGVTPTGGRTEVFFRLNTSSALSVDNISRFTLANDASRVTLTLVTAPSTPNLVVSNTTFAPTPAVLGYNLGTFMPGSNTADWWRYSGVNAARMFISTTFFAPMSPNSVIDQDTFKSSRTALRSNPLDPEWFDWPAIRNTFATGQNDEYAFEPVIRALDEIGVEMIMQMTTREGGIVITGPDDWTGKWRLWKHFYAMAFHLGRHFDVRRFQMYNEPDYIDDGETQPDILPARWLMRLQIVSDAVRCAIADVNSMYDKNLVPLIYAPTTFNANFTPDWGGLAIDNLKEDFLGVYPPGGFTLFDRYNWHQYNGSPSTYFNRVGQIRTDVENALPPSHPTMPLAMTEFNVHSARIFDEMPETLNSPSKFSRFGSIAAELARSRLEEMWVFKFSQTEYNGVNYAVAKNGMHFADVTNSPFNHGGPTHAAEVWRLFNKAFTTGRQLLEFEVNGTVGPLKILTGRDPATGRHYIFSANDSAAEMPLSIDISAWPIPSGAWALLEEVGPDSYGGVARSGYIPLSSGNLIQRTQPAYSVWLYTIETRPPAPDLVVPVAADAVVRDGSEINNPFGSLPEVVVKNHISQRNERHVGLLRYELPARYAPDLQLALLEVDVARLNPGTTAQAFVYGLNNTSWSEATVAWSGITNLRQSTDAGSLIQNNVVTDAGVSAFIQGQLVSTDSAFATRSLDVTSYVRQRLAAGDAAFMIAQENRWDKDLETGVVGDPAPRGLQIVSKEGATATGAASRLRLVFHKDSDGDGLSDQAESNDFTTDPTRPDTDGDGQNDGVEVTAGTDPNSGASWFKIEQINKVGSGYEITWSGVAGKVYTIQRATELAPANWISMSTVNGISGSQSWVDSNPPPGIAFYRIAVR